MLKISNLLLFIILHLKVIRVHCKQRTGSIDFIATIRTILANHYKDKTVGKCKSIYKMVNI